MTTNNPTFSSPSDQTAASLFALNDRLNHLLIEHIVPAAWTAQPPGRVRSIAASLPTSTTSASNGSASAQRTSSAHPNSTEPVAPPREAQAALAESASACARMLSEALTDPEAPIKLFRRDGWAAPWPVGPEMLCYMLVHEAHHRGQVCLLTHQLGSPLPPAVTSALWNWEKLRNTSTPTPPSVS